MATETSVVNGNRKLFINSDGSLNTKENQNTIKIEYSGSNPIYVGEASAGTATGAAFWRIKKITYSGSNPTDVQWADGTNAFTKVWDDRATYSYS